MLESLLNVKPEAVSVIENLYNSQKTILLNSYFVFCGLALLNAFVHSLLFCRLWQDCY